MPIPATAEAGEVHPGRVDVVGTHGVGDEVAHLIGCEAAGASLGWPRSCHVMLKQEPGKATSSQCS